jgi:hypothetical protein
MEARVWSVHMICSGIILHLSTAPHIPLEKDKGLKGKTTLIKYQAGEM